MITNRNICFLFKEPLKTWYFNHFSKILESHIDFKESQSPDYVVYNSHEKEFLNYRDSIRISFAQENIRPDFNTCDYAIGFDHLEFSDRYLRFPLFFLYRDKVELAQQKHKSIDIDLIRNKPGFCSFLVSNGGADELRTQFFHALSEYKKVDSGGKYLNNIGSYVSDKLDFQSKYKFTICFENSSTPGYLTEKLIEAAAARTIPIYWGDETAHIDINKNGSGINPKSYIHIKDAESFNDAIQYIIELDQDDNKYIEKLREPLFVHSNYVQFYDNRLREFMLNIFNQPIKQAFRRKAGQVALRYEEELKNMYQLRSTKFMMQSLLKRIFS